MRDHRALWRLYEHLRIWHGLSAVELTGLRTLDQLEAYHAHLAPDCTAAPE